MTREALTTEITRANVERLLDTGVLYAAMTNGRWWQCRRNGRTRTWKRQPERLYIPIKCGWKRFAHLTEDYFVDGKLDPSFFRHLDDTPQQRGLD